MATDIPRPRSYPQQLGDMIDAVTSRVGIRRLKVGGPLLSILEAAAQADVQQSQDVFHALASLELDNAEDAALDRIGAGEKVPRFLLARATGAVTVTSTAFARKATRVYQGLAAPIVGSVLLNVEDTAAWPSTGSVYVGRNTSNLEGPLAYTAIVNHGSYKTLSLSAPTTRFHNLGEGVVLAQGGNRVVDAGQIVATAQGALATAVQFATVFAVTIPDGEVEVTAVAVTATAPGAAGNVPALAVTEFVGGPPFAGAAVTNPRPFVTGRDNETNTAYRERIRQARNNRQRATDLAIENAVIGAFSPEESKRASSAKLVRRRADAVLYIDDGTGYEEAPAGVGLEVVMDSAGGGEDAFQTLQRPVSKAYLRAAAVAPYALADGMKLAVRVGGVVTTHAFDAPEFQAVDAASAYEVAASVNGNPGLLWAARTAGAGTAVVLYAKAETAEDVQLEAVTAPDADAGPVFEFPTTHRFTSLLYKNDVLLTKDGATAALRSNGFASWNAFSGPQTLVVAVDGTPAVTYTVTDADFFGAGTAFTVVGKNDLPSWAAVLNAKLPGVTAAVEADALVLTSNRGRAAAARVAVTGGTLIAQHVFALGASTGAAYDYTLDRGTGQIVTVAPLAAADRLTLGSAWPRAFLETPGFAAVTTGADVATWWVVDGAPALIAHGVASATPLQAALLAVTPRANIVGITATAASSVFANVLPGDWAVFWDDDTDLPAALRRAWRVTDVKPDLNRVVLERPAAALPRLKAGAAALLPVGGAISRILVCGGYTHVDGPASTWTHYGDGVTEEAEIHDPNTGAWAPAAAMTVARAAHTATTLADGRVFVVGGYDHDSGVLASSEIWDPATGLWTPGPSLAVARAEHTATLLGNGRVLIAGGVTAGVATNSAVEYNPTFNTFVNPTTMGTARYGHGAVLLPAGAGAAGAEAGNVLVVGGVNGAFTLASAERYLTATPGWAAKAGMGAGHERGYFGLAVAATQKVLAVGDAHATGGFSNDQRATYQVYDVTANTWTAAATVEAGWAFADKRYGAVKTPTNAAVVCYGGVFTSGGVKALRHKRFDGTTLAWTTTLDSHFHAGGVERTSVSGLALTGPASPDYAWFYGGVSETNTRTQDSNGPACATAELYNDDASAWVTTDPAAALNGTLGNRGLTFVRTGATLQRVVVPAALNYTAASLAALIEAGLEGGLASVYRTDRIRVQTASHALGAGLLLAASNNAAALPLPVGGGGTNAAGHFASVVSGSGLGTPQDFQVHALIGAAAAAHTPDAAETVFTALLDNDLQATAPMPTATVVGLKRWRDGLNPAWWQGAWTAGNDRSQPEYGNTKAVRAVIAAVDTAGIAPDRVRIGLRTAAEEVWAPGAPAIVALPYAVGPADDLTVVVDRDVETQRYAVAMARALVPADNNYGGTVALQDAAAGAVPLATTFGRFYDFNDLAIYMKARAKSHGSDASKRALWRFWRHGPEGEACVVRYTYPAGPAASVAVTTASEQDSVTNDLSGPVRVFADVQLGSGAARAASVFSPAARVGLARCNVNGFSVGDVYVLAGFTVVEGQRTSAGGTTRLRVQVPNNGTIAQGPQHSGVNAGDVLWFQAAAPGPTTLFSGAFTVASVAAFNAGTGTQDIFVPANTLHDGTAAWSLTSNPGTLSADALGEARYDAAAAVNDLVRLGGAAFAPSFTAYTMRVTALGRQYLLCRALQPVGAAPLTVPAWASLGAAANLAVFQGPTQTAAQVVAAANALAGDALSAPVTATVVGTGTGVIDKASWDELAAATGGYQLADGVNYVQRTVQPPDLVTPTSFLLKRPVTTDLTTNADWLHEDVRLAPLLASDVAAWLRTPAVTGLSSAAEVVVAHGGAAVQIASLTAGTAGTVEVEGGAANAATAAVVGAARRITRFGGGVEDTLVATVRRAEANGLIGGRWVRFDNTTALPKAAFWNVITTTIGGISGTGRWDFNTEPYSIVGQADETRIEVEAVGAFVAVHLPFEASATGLAFNQGVEYGYLYVTTPGTNRSDLPVVATANQGTYRIVRWTANRDGVTAWIENGHAVTESAVARVKVLSADSAVAGDVWAVSTTYFGAANKGQWRLVEVGAVTPGGEQYADRSFRVDTAAARPGAVGFTPLTVPSSLALQLRQGVPGRGYKRVVTVTPNTAAPDLVDVQLDTAASYGDVNAAAGTVLTALDKLGFPLGAATGVDGYAYATGLLGEVNKIVYGDASAPSLYPGYAAAGAVVLAQGAPVKRLKIALQLRVASGQATDDLADRVRSAVAAVVNQAGVGAPIALSDVVAAAGAVGGVVAVAVVAPTFSSTQDVIPVAPGEKPLVLDLRGDVAISFVGA